MGAFNMAFRAGGVMGFSLCGLGLLVLWCLLFVYKTFVYASTILLSSFNPCHDHLYRPWYD